MKILTRCGRGWIDTKENNMGTAAVKFKSAICWGTYYEVAAVTRIGHDYESAIVQIGFNKKIKYLQ